MPTAAQKGPAGEVTLLGSIGFDGKAMVVCMGRTCADTGRPHCGTKYVPSRDSILDFPIGAGLEAGSRERVIDARGCYVTPGFIETHNHFDAPMWWMPT